MGQVRRRLPPVGAEEEMDRPVVEIGAGLEISVDELAHLGGPVGEAEGHGRHGEGEEMLQEEAALGGLAAPVHTLQEDEGSAGRGSGGGTRRCWLGAVDDHGVRSNVPCCLLFELWHRIGASAANLAVAPSKPAGPIRDASQTSKQLNFTKIDN